MASGRNWTEASPITTCAPPGCGDLKPNSLLHVFHELQPWLAFWLQVSKLIGTSVEIRPLPLCENSQPSAACCEQAGRTSPIKIVWEGPSVIWLNLKFTPMRVNGPPD